MAEPIKTFLDYSILHQESIFTAKLDHMSMMILAERQIRSNIIEQASEKLAAHFIEQKGAEILAGVSAADISKQVVEQVVGRIIDQLKK